MYVDVNVDVDVDVRRESSEPDTRCFMESCKFLCHVVKLSGE